MQSVISFFSLDQKKICLPTISLVVWPAVAIFLRVQRHVGFAFNDLLRLENTIRQTVRLLDTLHIVRSSLADASCTFSPL